MFLSKKMKRPRMTWKEAGEIIKKSKTEEPLELEKNDLKAIILAALIVFIPFLLMFIVPFALLLLFIFNIWGG